MPLASKPPTFRNVPLKGTYYRGPSAMNVVHNLRVGDGLFLEREPSNPHDRYAIKVIYEEVLDTLTGRIHIGYIAKEKACRIAPYMDAGWMYMAYVQDTKFCLLKVVPILPIEKSANMRYNNSIPETSGV